MSDACCSPSKNESVPCGLPAVAIQRPERALNVCPGCGQAVKAVPGQTVKALLSVSLREVRDEVTYLFCRTPDCKIVYFDPLSAQTFTVEQVRERVYQKEPESEDVLACYCFRYAAGEIRAASPQHRAMIITDINQGIEHGQCACDLRNPQGTCCLGNVRAMVKLVERTQHAVSIAE